MKEQKSLFGTAKHYKVKVKKAKENPIKYILSVLSYAIFILLLLIGATLLVYVVRTKIKEAKGEPVNIKLINNNYDIIEQEQDRVKLFITFLAELMGFKPYLDKWNFNNLKLKEFSKGILDGKGEHKVLIQKIILI